MKLVQNYWIPFNAFLIAALYIPYIAGSALSGRWFVASLSLYWIRFWPFVFAIYCLVVLWFEHAMHWAILAGAFSLGTFCDTKTRDTVVLFFSCGIAVSFAFAVPQFLFDWKGVFQAASPAGLFINKNMFGEAACLALIALLNTSIKRSILFLTLAAILFLSTLITESRAVLLALLLSSLLLLRVWYFLGGVFLFLLLGWLYLDHSSFDLRLMLWKTFEPSLLGNGDWWFNTLQYDADGHMHNDWLQLAHEIGVVCLIPFGMIGYVFVAQSNARYFIMALGALGLFSFPLQMPATGWFSAFMLGTYLFNSFNKRGNSLRVSV